jgi:hypothetical protein
VAIKLGHNPITLDKSLFNSFKREKKWIFEALRRIRKLFEVRISFAIVVRGSKWIERPLKFMPRLFFLQPIF